MRIVRLLDRWVMPRRRWLLGAGALATAVVMGKRPAEAWTKFPRSRQAQAPAETSDPGDWRPLPEGSVSRIAFGSCAKQWQAQPIWHAVIDTDPDVFLFIGDAIYADTDGVTAWEVSESQLRGEWNRLVDKPEFQAVKANIPFMAAWDNHDYGTHNGGAEFELKEASRKPEFLTQFR